MKNLILLITLLFSAHFAAVRAQPHGELPLPKVPEELTIPADRAAYVAEHFWDAMNWQDTTLLRDTLFMEQSFANFLSVFPLLSQEVAGKAVNVLMRKAGDNREAYKMIAGMADKYLYDPESPMMNDEVYALFLEEMTRTTLLDEADKARCAHELRAVNVNRRGSMAADFSYIDRSGKRCTMHTTAAKAMVLLFYDPDCEHCTETVNALKADTTLRDVIKAGKVTVLAVYAGGDRALWDRTKNDLPSEWVVGFDVTGIQQHGKYILRAMPTMYLLDSDKTVVAKDLNPATLREFVGSSVNG